MDQECTEASARATPSTAPRSVRHDDSAAISSAEATIEATPMPTADPAQTEMHTVALNTPRAPVVPEPVPISVREEFPERAKLMDSGWDLVDWQRAARPMESVLLICVLGLVSSSLGSTDWAFTSDGGSAGLKIFKTAADVQPETLAQGCAGRAADSAACALSAAAMPALVLTWCAIVVTLCLGALFMLEELERRELLGPIRTLCPSVDKLGLLQARRSGFVRPCPPRRLCPPLGDPTRSAPARPPTRSPQAIQPPSRPPARPRPAARSPSHPSTCSGTSAPSTPHAPVRRPWAGSSSSPCNRHVTAM